MVINVFGLPRAGKSTFLAYCAKCALSGKSITVGAFGWRVSVGEFAPYKHVYSNFPLKGCCKMNFDDFGQIDFTNSLCLIDEISLYADARDYKTFSKVIKEYFALHGHYKNDIIICSQNFEDSDKRIRNLAAILLQVDKFGAFSRVRPIRRGQDVIHGECFTVAPPLSSTWLYRKPYYPMFDSFAAPALAPNPATLWEFGSPALSRADRSFIRSHIRSRFSSGAPVFHVEQIPPKRSGSKA